jgi:hypothetical protein
VYNAFIHVFRNPNIDFWGFIFDCSIYFGEAEPECQATHVKFGSPHETICARLINIFLWINRLLSQDVPNMCCHLGLEKTVLRRGSPYPFLSIRLLSGSTSCKMSGNNLWTRAIARHKILPFTRGRTMGITTPANQSMTRIILQHPAPTILQEQAATNATIHMQDPFKYTHITQTYREMPHVIPEPERPIMEAPTSISFIPYYKPSWSVSSLIQRFKCGRWGFILGRHTKIGHTGCRTSDLSRIKRVLYPAHRINGYL